MQNGIRISMRQKWSGRREKKGKPADSCCSLYSALIYVCTRKTCLKLQKKIIKECIKKICIKCEALPSNTRIIWFINEDMQLSILLSYENSSRFLTSPLVMTWLNIIYDSNHKLFTNALINYVCPKCNISDYV